MVGRDLKHILGINESKRYNASNSKKHEIKPVTNTSKDMLSSFIKPNTALL